MREFTRRRLARIVDGALREAGVLGVRPTPLAAVAEAAGVRGVEPIERLPLAGGRLLGALWYPERTIFVAAGQSEPRRRFTEAHEIVHALLPWHEAVLRVDTEAELFRPVAEELEAEANAGAARLIFQGEAFADRLGAEPPSLERAVDEAAAHGASVHATLHEMVSAHPGACALLTTGRFRSREGALPVWRTVGSRAFRSRFSPSRLHAAMRPGRELDELAEAARATGLAARTLAVRDRAGATRRCHAEAYYNRHSFLIVVSERRMRSRAATG